MALRIRPARNPAEFEEAIGAISHYFGGDWSAEAAERFGRLLPAERMHAAFDGDAIVGGAGAFPFELAVPGAQVPCAGVTVVGVLPTHRRRGILDRMMRAQLADVRERGEPLAALWASEETIYGRFGYGLSAQDVMIRASRVHAALRPDLPGPDGHHAPRRITTRRSRCFRGSTTASRGGRRVSSHGRATGGSSGNSTTGPSAGAGRAC